MSTGFWLVYLFGVVTGGCLVGGFMWWLQHNKRRWTA